MAERPTSEFRGQAAASGKAGGDRIGRQSLGFPEAGTNKSTGKSKSIWGLWKRRPRRSLGTSRRRWRGSEAAGGMAATPQRHRRSGALVCVRVGERDEEERLGSGLARSSQARLTQSFGSGPVGPIGLSPICQLSIFFL